MQPSYKIAIVHDWLNQVGGAENVLEEMVALFPEADVFTSIFAPEKMPPSFQHLPIHTSFMQKFPYVTTHHQQYMPIYPLAFQQFHLDSYDLVLSNKSGFCHGVRTKSIQSAFQNATFYNTRKNGHPPNGALHVCYCLTPTRFLWSLDHYLSRERFGLTGSMLLRPLLPALRWWDRNAAQRVDHFVAISREIQQRILKLYGRESTIIYPPVDTGFFTPSDSIVRNSTLSQNNGVNRHGQVSSQTPCPMPSHISEDIGLPAEIASQGYYLIVSRLIPYKRIDLAVKAFAHLPTERLVIVGDGRDRQTLELIANDNVIFLGRLNRNRVRELLRYCKAFIFPGLEDFGIAPVEAMSSGRPVIAYAGGGALDTILPGRSGELFQDQTVESLLDTLKRFQPSYYSPDACRHQAEKFSVQNFHSNLRGFIEQLLVEKWESINKKANPTADKHLYSGSA
ncbi:MAG: glycosyltransferase [Chloroflexota bacterium]